MKKFLVICLCAVMLICSSAFAQSVLNVNGTGTVMVEADIVTISLGVSKMGEDLTGLQSEVNSTVESICAALEAKGVDKKDISTNYLYIYPQYDYSQDVPQMVGYSINNNLMIVTESIDKAGELIDAAFAAGANSFDSISFSLKDESAARNQALEMAVQDAFAKADVIAAASGKAIEGVISIDEAANDMAYSNSASGSAKVYESADSVARGTTVRAAQVAVTANVKISFEIR